MLKNFELNKVKLFDNDFNYRRELVKKYISEFSVDRLMHSFRLNAGIESNVEPLGGWEDVNCGLRGHFAGHFLSCCAKFSFSDDDTSLKIKAEEIIDIMESCAKPNGYLSAFEEEKLDILENEENRDVWAPYYTLHKILQGLIDCFTFLGNKRSLDLAVNLAHYILGRFKKLSYWKIDGILRCTKVNPVNEFGGIGDALYSLYEITGDSEIYELANIFDREYLIDKLACEQDVLENLHANTHLPMILSAMHRYDIGGEEKYKAAAVNFYDYLLGRTFCNGNNSSKATAYINGGVSEKSEHWGAFGRLEDALTGGESESCCAHNTEKILEKLFRWKEDVDYLDHMESLKYNAVLNSASNTTGLSQYHQPMGTGAVKKFSGSYDTFWCCTASGIEAMSEVQKNIWYKGKDTLLLNMFIASAVIWDEKDVIVTQITNYPDQPVALLEVKAKAPTEFKLLLKSGNVKAVKINEAEIELNRKNGYIVIERVFDDGDKILIEIDSRLHMVPLKGSKDIYSVMYGKILLAQLGDVTSIGKITNENICERLVRSYEKGLSFHINIGDMPLELKPLYRIENEVYSVYMNTGDNTLHHNIYSVAKDGSYAYNK